MTNPTEPKHTFAEPRTFTMLTALLAMFDGALATHSDVTVDGVRCPMAGEALRSWASANGFPVVAEVVTPSPDAIHSNPYEVLRVSIGIARIAVLCSRLV